MHMAQREVPEFGQWVAAVRSERGMDQKALAKVLGFDPSYVGRIESGKRPPTAEFSLALSRSLELPLEDVLLRAGLVTTDDLAAMQAARDQLKDDLGRIQRKLARLSPAQRARYLRIFEAVLEAGESG